MATTKQNNMIPRATVPYTTRLKIVRERLAIARRANRYENIPKPAKVQAAEKVLAEWKARDDAARDAHYAKHQAKVREIEDALILGDVEKVLKLLAAIGA